MNGISIQLAEWEKLEPEPGSLLSGFSLSGWESAAEKLTDDRQLEILELASGLQVRAFSWVGRVQLGALTITVQPKINGLPLLNLLRYAFRFEQLSLRETARFGSEPASFQDLIAWQLATEVEKLIARGLHHEYRREPALLAVPKGRIDFQRVVTATGGARAVLPCVHHPRTRETILNHVLFAGTVVASRATSDKELRGRLRRLGKAIESDEPLRRLDSTVLEKAGRSIDRRTRPYEPALALIEVLTQGLGVSLNASPGAMQLSGFLFDMNRFFQTLISRFLRDHLVGYQVRDEHGLKEVFAYARGGNPKGCVAPTLRPDFMVFANGKVVSVLDAKYRDLWKNSLPSEMLYQLAVYALGHSGSERQAVILYPTLEAGVVDQTILLNEPLYGTERARIVLRPVPLLELDQLITEAPNVRRDHRCAALAQRLVFGNDAVETISHAG